MDQTVRKHKNVGRFVAFLGILPGVWFLIARYTQVGTELEIKCGYWMVALVMLTAIWVTYAIFTKILMKDIGIAHDHAHSLTEQRQLKFAYASTFIEAIVASLIFGLSLFGFLITDLQCYISQAM